MNFACRENSPCNIFSPKESKTQFDHFLKEAFLEFEIKFFGEGPASESRKKFRLHPEFLNKSTNLFSV
jgi:hypothetical protein